MQLIFWIIYPSQHWFLFPIHKSWKEPRGENSASFWGSNHVKIGHHLTRRRLNLYIYRPARREFVQIPTSPEFVQSFACLSWRHSTVQWFLVPVRDCETFHARLAACFFIVADFSEVQRELSERDIDYWVNHSPETCIFSPGVWEPQSCCSIRAERGSGPRIKVERRQGKIYETIWTGGKRQRHYRARHTGYTPSTF